MSIVLKQRYRFKNAWITAADEPCYIKRQINLLPSTSQTPKQPERRRNSFLDSKFGELYVPATCASGASEKTHSFPSSFCVQSQMLVGRRVSFPTIGATVSKEGWKCIQSHRTKIHPLAEKSTQKEHLVELTKSSFQNTAKVHRENGK